MYWLSGMCFCRVAVLIAVMICRVMQSSAKARKLVGLEIADGLVEADHSFLDDIFAIRSDKKVALRLNTDEVLIFIKEVLHREVVTGLRNGDEILVNPLLVLHAIRCGMGHCHNFLSASW